ncbi:hypothetical protein GCM10012275_53070 [Longimycelium tulufanense]|uniref:Uncharacterized protein n=1 Tax=Longimycelium tulufanense TaxID=907463 RepID=A0A8J3FX04_9PSEU|nr:hypothetical protein [Longimycelium tulufanense]GGM75750.1 hypothetical protein GCM10012275_53070 [Longimycelium tulufanense]
MIIHPVTVILARPTTRLGRTRITLTPGVIDEWAEEMFGHGMCHALASAIHAITDWPFAIIEQREWYEWRAKHVGVVTPKGYFLDIRGTHLMQIRDEGRIRRPAMLRDVMAAFGLTIVYGLSWSESQRSDWWTKLFPAEANEIIWQFATQLIFRARCAR